MNDPEPTIHKSYHSGSFESLFYINVSIPSDDPRMFDGDITLMFFIEAGIQYNFTAVTP